MGAVDEKSFVPHISKFKLFAHMINPGLFKVVFNTLSVVSIFKHVRVRFSITEPYYSQNCCFIICTN